MRDKQKVKTISINLKKQVEKRSPSSSPDRFKLPISHLRTTFSPRTNIFQQIQKQHETKVNGEKLRKKEEQRIKSQIMDDWKNDNSEIDEEDLQLCKSIFNMINNRNREYVEEEDLQALADGQAKQKLRTVFYRKQRQILFDFIFNLWDTGVIAKLRNSA